MSFAAKRHLSPAVLALRRRVAAASDAQILRILATVDSMADRGEADELVSPLRERLNVLRPPRRLRFRRLLFYPLGPLMVSPADWRPTLPCIPRSALPPIADQVRAALPAMVADLEARIDNITTAERERIARLGDILWPAAAQVLADAQLPPGWREAGLGGRHHAALAPVLAALLFQAPAVEYLCLTSVEGLLPPDPQALRTILDVTTNQHLPALSFLLGLLLMRLPDASGLFGCLETPHALIALDQAADWLIARLTAETPARWIASGTLQEAATTLRRLCALLDQIEALPAARGRQAQCRRLRGQLHLACRDRFTAGLWDDLLTPLTDFAAWPEARALEEAARGVRLFAQEARRLGDGDIYDQGLSEAAARLKAPNAPMPRVALIRLVEILESPAAALALMAEKPG